MCRFEKQRGNSKSELWVETDVTAAHGRWEMVLGPPSGKLGFMHCVGIADVVLNL